MTVENDFSDDVFKGYGVKIDLTSDFTRVREVLTRIGIANHKNKVLTQSCHIFHKRGEYAIMHFKEMFLFDGKESDFTDEDEARRNRIIKMLLEWGLIKINDDENWNPNDNMAPINAVNVISRKVMHDDKWSLVKKYTLGKK